MPTTRVLDSTMYHRETGAGAPIVFLHGNPTSSYLWRNVLPAVGPGRLLAPDLIGMGESGKPPIAYDFADHARYLDAWFDALGLDDAVLVGHDWGGALALDRAARHPDRVRGVALTETILKPLAWNEFPAAGRDLWRAIRTEGVGEEMFLGDGFVTDGLAAISSRLGPADLAAYRAPYPTRQSRIPLLRWARSIPLDGTPADVVTRVTAYDEWLAGSPDVPKLLVTFAPGYGTMTVPAVVDWCADPIAGLEIDAYDEVAGHHTPEDRPDLLAGSVARWLDRHRLR
ncbi:haloalkane dehalogenase [Actinocatenispora rupis]|uniref:Haloalkane dehalogenase n=1 Tax=Actinocatenispora rupis TaxID=519421 RepID=A0A8J3JK02_9ACTN|nr:haloalkane dehalogenase [Actinocatenispora rupis]GID16323.1 haloalkane dehalogenase [Actinocatenispora rupis]